MTESQRGENKWSWSQVLETNSNPDLQPETDFFQTSIFQVHWGIFYKTIIEVLGSWTFSTARLILPTWRTSINDTSMSLCHGVVYFILSVCLPYITQAWCCECTDNEWSEGGTAISTLLPMYQPTPKTGSCWDMQVNRNFLNCWMGSYHLYNASVSKAWANWKSSGRAQIITQKGYEWGMHDPIKSPHWGIPEIFGNTLKK